MARLQQDGNSTRVPEFEAQVPWSVAEAVRMLVYCVFVLAVVFALAAVVAATLVAFTPAKHRIHRTRTSFHDVSGTPFTPFTPVR